MKKFIFKTLLFVAPFLFFYIISKLFYGDFENPDLIRLAHIPTINKEYRTPFSIRETINFVNISNAKEKNYKVLIIGDSFSEQGANGYKNYLADSFSVLHFTQFEMNRQFQTLISLLNGDYFDIYYHQYVVLQNVERHILYGLEKIDFNRKLMVSQIDSIISKEKKTESESKNKNEYDFFSRTTLLFPLFGIPQYFLRTNYVSNNEAHIVELNSDTLFSNGSNKLLFYWMDLQSVEKNNEINNTIKLNNLLNELANRLKNKGITLIVLPSPDKYDLYYDFIKDKSHFVKPVFFDNMKLAEKKYIYIDSKEILSYNLKKSKDIYYHGDTHWSPVAAKIIADKIKEEIVKNDTHKNADKPTE